MNAKQYTYRVLWSEDDQEFVGLCAEFPSLSCLEMEQDAALHGIVRLVEDTIKDMIHNGKDGAATSCLEKVFRSFCCANHAGNASSACYSVRRSQG